jgi:hypothetical protein
MSSHEDEQRHVSSKGKGRARCEDLDESTPLLASGSGNLLEADIPPRRRRLATRLLSVFVFSSALCAAAFVLAVVIAYLYGSRASDISPEQIQRSIKFRGPDDLNIMSVDRDGLVRLQLQGRIGIDAAAVLGVHDNEDDNIFMYIWKSIGRWGVREMDRISVNLSSIEVFSKIAHDHLLDVSMPPFELPLTASPPPDDSWLTNMTIPLSLAPTRNSSALMQFVRNSWRDGALQFTVTVQCAAISGGGIDERSWRSRLRAVRTNVRVPFTVKSMSHLMICYAI